MDKIHRIVAILKDSVSIKDAWERFTDAQQVICWGSYPERGSGRAFGWKDLHITSNPEQMCWQCQTQHGWDVEQEHWDDEYNGY